MILMPLLEFTYPQDSILQDVLVYVSGSACPPSTLHAKRRSDLPPCSRQQCCLHIPNLGSKKSSRLWRYPRLNRCPQSCKSAGGKKDSFQGSPLLLGTWTS